MHSLYPVGWNPPRVPPASPRTPPQNRSRNPLLHPISWPLGAALCMEEAATQATTSPNAETVKPAPAERSGPSPTERGAPTATPAPSSAPTTPPEPATTPAAAPTTSEPPTAPPAALQQPPAASREPMAPSIASSAPSTPAPAAAASAGSTARPAPPAPPAAAGHQQSSIGKKRMLEKSELQESAYFKIRAIVRDLRPAFIEVLQASDFRNCKAADDIRRQMKVLVDLSNQLRTEGVSSGNKNTTEGQSLAEDRREAMESRIKVEKQAGPDSALASVQNQAGKAAGVAVDMITEAKGIEKQLQGHQGTYIVGGSPMGWNFLVYRGSEPVYYGVTKEAARSRRSCS